MLIIFLPVTRGSDQWGREDWEGPGPDQQITIFAPGLTGSGQPGAKPDIVIPTIKKSLSLSHVQKT